MLDGVKHILLTEHLDMTDSPTEIDEEAQRQKQAIGVLKESTRSIGGRCSTPPPASFGLTESVPLGACAILVKQDFLNVRTIQFWLDSVYVAIAAPGTSDRSVLIVHMSGLMWITNSVFQGAGYNCRGVDVARADDEQHQMYVRGTTFAGFTRDLAPGIAVRPNASLALVDVSFRNLELLRGVRDYLELGTAVAAYEGAGVLMQGVSFAGHLIHHEPANGREVGLSAGPPAAVAFSAPPHPVWRWPAGPLEDTQDTMKFELFTPGFLSERGPLEGIQAEQQSLVEHNLGPLAPLQAVAPPPATAPGPGVRAAPPPAVPSDVVPSPELPLELPSQEFGPQDEWSWTVAQDSAAPPGAAATVDNVQARSVTDDKASTRFALVLLCAVGAGVAAGLCAVAGILAMQRQQRKLVAQQSLAATLKPQAAPVVPEPQAAVGQWPVNST